MGLGIYRESDDELPPRQYFIPTRDGQWVEITREHVDDMLPKNGRWKHPDPLHWHIVRLAALERDCFACVVDALHRSDLQVHHRTYLRWGRELVTDLYTLCRPCHELIEVNKRVRRAA